MAEYDMGIMGLAQQILGQPEPKSDPPAVEPNAGRQVPETELEAGPGITTDVPRSREIKTAAELARMIEADLAKHPDCPRKGLVVTVYGATLWRAMLTITPAAGPVRNPQEWRDLTEELADRLRKRYDLAWR